MDPKQLDPKLKEAYDRVMGTSFTPPAATPTPTQSASTPAPVAEPAPIVPAAEPMATQTPVTPQPVTPVELTSEPVPFQPTTSVESKMPINGFVAADANTQKKHGVSPVIIILGVIVFLVVYALFWVKFFGVSLPFLPQ